MSIELAPPTDLPGAEDTRAWGRALAARLRAGDVVVLTGELGAGKTTLTQGLADGLGVRGPITSPTFVIARVHPSLVGGPALVHVDAYRLGGAPELDDLDLDASTQDSVTVVEWGHGLAEALADSWLEVELTRALADDPRPGNPHLQVPSPEDSNHLNHPNHLEDPSPEDPRVVRLVGHGPRWES